MSKKKIEYPEGYVFPNKQWKVIKEINKKNKDRYFLCECLLCGDKYEVSLNSLRNKNISFCCQSCARSRYSENRADALIGKVFSRITVISKHSQNKHGQWQYLCRCECGNEKIILGTSLTNHITMSCGCYHIDRIKEANSGENHYNWKGGKTTQNTSDRNKITGSINPTIRNRDNFTCQNCFQYSGYLECHHIFDFATYPELKFEEVNLITLCKNCHTDFHSIYPTKLTNTLTDLEDWMKKEYKYHNELLEIYNDYYK